MGSFFSKMFSKLTPRNFIKKATKSFVSIFLVLIFIVKYFLFPAQLFSIELTTHGKNVVLIDEKTGKVLFTKNSDQLVSSASTTKIAATLYASKLLLGKPLDTIIEAPLESLLIAPKALKKKNNYQGKPYLLEPDGVTFHIRKSEKLSIMTLLEGMMIYSANDAANVVAHFLGDGSIERFTAGMNAQLRAIGCTKTTYHNPHGLHYPGHLSTAYELALMTREALKDPLIQKLYSATIVNRPKTNKNAPMLLYTNNALSLEGKFHYPYCTGGKTGYIEDAGYCLVASADNGKRSLIAVILGCKKREHRFLDAIELFNQAFSEPLLKRKIFHAEDAFFKFEDSRCNEQPELCLKEDLFVEYYPSVNPEIKTEVKLFGKNAPYKMGCELGELVVFLDEEKVLTVPLFARKDYPLKWQSAASLFLKSYSLLIICSFVGCIFLTQLVRVKIKNSKSLSRAKLFRS